MKINEYYFRYSFDPLKNIYIFKRIEVNGIFSLLQMA
jgi:hypothetical protein